LKNNNKLNNNNGMKIGSQEKGGDWCVENVIDEKQKYK
jgi:hypothetical protein